MKKIIQYVILILLVAALTDPVLGFPGMTNNKSTTPQNTDLDTNNTTQSDQDIQIQSHLIELDAAQFESQNELYVRETLIFKNVGDKNFSGTLRTWVPDGTISPSIKIGKVQMMAGSEPTPLLWVQNGNIISWQDRIEKNSPLPLLYSVEYVLSAEPSGTITQSKYYSKKLVYPTLINYRYEGTSGLPVMILKIEKPEGSSVTILDENRNKVTSQEESEEGNAVVSRFDSVQFKELNVEISKSAVTPFQVGIYFTLGFVVLLALSYPFVRRKSERLQAIEERIKSSLKGGDADEEAEEEDVPENTVEPETVPEEVDEEFSGRTKDELESERSELLSKLDELEKGYTSGDLLDEEYEELRNPYQERVEKLSKAIERLG